MLHILWYVVVGFVVGVIARALHPGADSMGFLMTTLIGILGSVIGGLIGHLFRRPAPGTPFHPPGLILSVLGAILVLVLMNHFGHS
jgi:uncharacterized membrane protein YeaQ/YmgE (transglycosylase-associated protein family)